MKTIRILIVDDLPQVRQGLATVLELAAHKDQFRIEVVGFAQDGNEAVEKAAALHPDVILMDLEMPILDGFEATRRIKAEQPAGRVIVLTIHSSPEMQARARAVGADGFVTKGADIQTLLNAILAMDGSNISFEKGEKT
jgi:DNA-binding NarL/FixJ family response regulator